MEKAGFTRRRKAALLVVLLLAVASASFVLALGSKSPEPPWLVVPRDYPTIQEAIDAAEPGWGIVVFAGTYAGDIEVYKPLTLIAKGDVRLDADGEMYVFHVTADDVTIEGFKVEGASHSGIRLSRVQDCKIRSNTVEGNVIGIYLLYSHDNVVSGNVLEKNLDHSILLSFSGSNIVKNNIAENTSVADGIRLHESDCNAILYNTVTLSNRSGIMLSRSCGNKLEANVANENGLGIWLHTSSGNAIKDNTLEENRGNGIYVWNWSDGNAVEDNTVTQNNASGILLSKVIDNVVKGNTVTNNGAAGIHLHTANSNVVKGNIATHNDRSINRILGNIFLAHSSWNNVKDNQASFSTTSHGIYLLGDSDFNVVDGNVAVNNTDAGIKLRPIYYPATVTPDHNTISNNIALYNSVDLSGTTEGTFNRWFDNYYETITETDP